MGPTRLSRSACLPNISLTGSNHASERLANKWPRMVAGGWWLVAGGWSKVPSPCLALPQFFFILHEILASNMLIYRLFYRFITAVDWAMRQQISITRKTLRLRYCFLLCWAVYLTLSLSTRHKYDSCHIWSRACHDPWSSMLTREASPGFIKIVIYWYLSI
jgi:hypothetical protein